MEMKDYTRFSCCAYWQQCDLGRGVCVFNDTEPNKKSFCGAYLNRDFRNDLQQAIDVQKVEVNEPELIAQSTQEPAATQNVDEDLFLIADGTPLTSAKKPAKEQSFIESTGQFTLF